MAEEVLVILREADNLDEMKRVLIVAGGDTFRICSECGDAKTLSDFSPNRLMCRICVSARQRNIYKGDRTSVQHQNRSCKEIFVTGENSFKECTVCGKIKPLLDFSTNSCYVNGINSRCRKCCNEKRRINYFDNLERETQRRKEYISKQDKAELAKKKRAWAASNPDSIKNTNYKKLYGITLDDVRNMVASQNNLCLICKEPFTDENPYVIDHCHVSMKVRGAVHSSCNQILGMARDRIDILQGAVQYLSRSV